MRSHRLALAALLLAPVAAAGCGSGKDTNAFLSPGAGNTAVAAAAETPVAAEAAPVVIAGPDDAVIEERDAAKAAADANLSVAEKAEKARKEAKRDLREERDKAERARKRAAKREARLRAALSDATERREAARAETATPKPAATQDTITGSSVEGATLTAERDRRSAAEARAAVVRLHEMLGNRDARACDALTQKLLEATYGAEPGAIDRCRAAVAAVDSAVAVTISEARAHGRTASVAAISRLGDSEVPQTFALVLVNGTWLIDAIERRPAA